MHESRHHLLSSFQERDIPCTCMPSIPVDNNRSASVHVASSAIAHPTALGSRQTPWSSYRSQQSRHQASPKKEVDVANLSKIFAQAREFLGKLPPSEAHLLNDDDGSTAR